MRCLHVLPMSKLSGAEKLALILCKNMIKYEPIVVCGGEGLKNIFEDNGIKSYSINFSNNILKNAKELKKIIEENDIKIIHAHDNNASINSYITKKLYKLNIKIVSHIHSCYPWLKVNSKNKKIDEFFRKKYDYNIACGKLVYDYYTKNSSYVNKNNTIILSNAIDISEIKEYMFNDTEKIYEEFKIPRNKTILGFVGRLTEAKGIIPFIKEVSKNREKFNDCIFLLVGSGEQKMEVKSLLRNLKLNDLFILTGHQDNVYKFYPIIDIFFLPSLYEGLPMVILEAMSFKKPIVAMDVGSINELVKNDKTGILIEAENYKKFLEGLKELKEQKIKRENLMNNGFNYVKKNFDIKVYINNMENLYDSIICK